MCLLMEGRWSISFATEYCCVRLCFPWSYGSNFVVVLSPIHLDVHSEFFFLFLVTDYYWWQSKAESNSSARDDSKADDEQKQKVEKTGSRPENTDDDKEEVCFDPGVVSLSQNAIICEFYTISTEDSRLQPFYGFFLSNIFTYYHQTFIILMFNSFISLLWFWFRLLWLSFVELFHYLITIEF